MLEANTHIEGKDKEKVASVLQVGPLVSERRMEVGEVVDVVTMGRHFAAQAVVAGAAVRLLPATQIVLGMAAAQTTERSLRVVTSG